MIKTVFHRCYDFLQSDVSGPVDRWSSSGIEFDVLNGTGVLEHFLIGPKSNLAI